MIYDIKSDSLKMKEINETKTYESFCPDAIEYVPMNNLINRMIYIIGSRAYEKDGERKYFFSFVSSESFPVTYVSREGERKSFTVITEQDKNGSYPIYFSNTMAKAIVDKLERMSEKAKISAEDDGFSRPVACTIVAKQSKSGRAYYDLV